MAYFDPSGTECTYSDAYSGGKLRPGYRDILGNGERVGFEMAFVDRAPSRLMFADSRPIDRAGIEAARLAWLDAKQNQYRGQGEPPSESRTTDPRAGLRDAKSARLARLANAYRTDH